MKLEEIEELWGKDLKIDRSQLDTESLRIPELHNKYYKIYIREKIQYNKISFDLDKLTKQKKEWYEGTMPEEELKELGWEPFNLLLKKDLPIYLNSDEDLISLKLKLALAHEKVEYLKSIIKDINSRSFNIKNAIDFLKFTNGGI